MKNYDCKQCKVAADRSIFLTNLIKKFSRGGRVQTAEATVVSKRLSAARFPTQGNTWDWWVKFRLDDNAEAELIATEEQFKSLSQGEAGMLSWEGETILSFTQKE